MRATSDFTAAIGGITYALRKGETFRGDARAAEHLKAIGLLAERAPRRKKDGNER